MEVRATAARAPAEAGGGGLKVLGKGTTYSGTFFSHKRKSRALQALRRRRGEIIAELCRPKQVVASGANRFA